MWSLPGGKQEDGESLFESLTRECQEEIGFWPVCLQLTPLEKFTTPSSHFTYHTFFAAVVSEFIPRLNREHIGYAWVDSGILPKPLHPGLRSTVRYKEIRHKLSKLESSFLTIKKAV